MSLIRAYPRPAAPSAIQPIHSTAPKRCLPQKAEGDFTIGLILAFMLSCPLVRAQDPPPNLARLVAHRESETEAERNEYMYRQTVTVEELDDHGGARGNYREIRDIIFSPKHQRTEEPIGRPQNNLKYLTMTDEDFRDIRDIQPLVLTEDRLDWK